MVSRKEIENIIENIISSSDKKIIIKCKPPIDENAFNNLHSNEEIAEFFGLEYLPKGRPDLSDDEKNWANESIAFYDKRNHVLLNFLTHEDRRIKSLDFTNNHSDDSDDNYLANLKDVIRAYYEAPYVLKKGLWLMQFERGYDLEKAGECDMYGVTMYNASLWGGGVEETMYHEMAHALSFQNIDWRNGEKIDRDTLPKPLSDMWSEATQKDYEFQEQHNLPHQDTSDYGETNQHEDFAEMGAVVAGKMVKAPYNHLSNGYAIYKDDPTRSSGREFDHYQSLDEIIEANPHRAELMKDLMKNGKNVDIENKREYMNNMYQQLSDDYGEELKETW